MESVGDGCWHGSSLKGEEGERKTPNKVRYGGEPNKRNIKKWNGKKRKGWLG